MGKGIQPQSPSLWIMSAAERKRMNENRDMHIGFVQMNADSFITEECDVE